MMTEQPVHVAHLNNETPKNHTLGLFYNEVEKITENAILQYFSATMPEESVAEPRLRQAGQTLPPLKAGEILEIYNQVIFNLSQSFCLPCDIFLNTALFSAMPFSMEEVYGICTEKELLIEIRSKYQELYLDPLSPEFTPSISVEQKEKITSLAQSKVFLQQVIRYCLRTAVNALIEQESNNIVKKLKQDYDILNVVTSDLTNIPLDAKFLSMQDEDALVAKDDVVRNALLLIDSINPVLPIKKYYFEAVDRQLFLRLPRRPAKARGLLAEALNQQAVMSRRVYVELSH